MATPWWEQILVSTAKALLAVAGNDPSAPVASTSAGTLTAAEAQKALQALQSSQLTDFFNAFSQKLLNLQADAVVAEDIVADLAPIIPDAALIAIAIRLLAWVAANNQSASGGQLPPNAGGSGGRGSDPWMEGQQP